MALISNQTYDELYDEYNDISFRTSISSTAATFAGAVVDQITKSRVLKSIDPKRTSHVQPTRVHLKRTNVLPEAERTVDKYINTMVERAREENRPTGELSAILSQGVDAYYKGVQQQLQADTETFNREAEINAGAEQQTKLANAEIDARNNQLDFEGQLKRAEIYSIYNDRLKMDLLTSAAIIGRARKARFNVGLDMKTRAEDKTERDRLAGIDAKLLDMREREFAMQEDSFNFLKGRRGADVTYQDISRENNLKMFDKNLIGAGYSNQISRYYAEYLRDLKKRDFGFFNNSLRRTHFGNKASGMSVSDLF